MLAIEKFLFNQHYLFEIEEWFEDLWVYIFENKDVVISYGILLFLYRNKTVPLKFNVNFLDEIEKIEEMYKRLLIENNIDFEIIPYNREIIQDYPNLEFERTKSWIKLTHINFKLSLGCFKKKELLEYYFRFEDIVLNYKTSLLKAENEQLKMKLIKKKDFIFRITDFDQKEYNNFFYNNLFCVITTDEDIKEHKYKLTGIDVNKILTKSVTLDLNSIIKNDKKYFAIAVYKTYNYKLLKLYVSSFLAVFKTKDDFFQIQLNDLLSLLDEVVEKINKQIFNTIILNQYTYKEDKKIDQFIQQSTIYRNPVIQSIK